MPRLAYKVKFHENSPKLIGWLTEEELLLAQNVEELLEHVVIPDLPSSTVKELN